MPTALALSTTLSSGLFVAHSGMSTSMSTSVLVSHNSEDSDGSGSFRNEVLLLDTANCYTQKASNASRASQLLHMRL